MIQLYLIALVVAFGTGALSGAKLTYKLTGVAQLRQEVASLKQQRQTYRAAVGIANKHEDEDATASEANEAVVGAILAKARDTCPVPGYAPSSIATSIPAPVVARVCLDVERLRELGNIK